MSYEMMVSDVLGKIDLEARTAIEFWLKELGMEPSSVSISDLIAEARRDNVPREFTFATFKCMKVTDGKFSAKLDHAKRCEILALRRMGIAIKTLSAVYGVNRRTIVHICVNNGPHYRNIRALEKEMGEERFRNDYVTQAVMDRVLMHQQAESISIKNNKHANGKAGVHVVKGKNCSREHRITIQWHEASDELPAAGWYYRDLDGNFPDSWCWVDDKSLTTSMACYMAMLGDISDRLE